MKTHRIISIVLGAALTASLAGCSKEAVGSAGQSAEQQFEEFSLSAALTVPGGDTKVTLGGDQGLSPLWETGDQILVLDDKKNPLGGDGTFTLTSGDGAKSGTFSGKKYLGQKPAAAYAIYPASVYDAETGKFTLPATQDGTIKSAVMLGEIVQGDNGFATTFTNVCSVLKINTGDYGKTVGAPAIKSVTVSAGSGIAGEFTIDWNNLSISLATDGTASNSVTAEATSESGFATGTNIYIPVIPASSQTFDFKFTNTTGRSGNLSGELTAAANKIKDLGTAGRVDFLMPIILPGEFTVSAGEDEVAGTDDDVKVRFSRGNLYWNGSEFLFEKKQWERTPSSNVTWDPSHVSHFFMSTDARVAYSADYNAANTEYGITPSEEDVFFTNDPSYAEKANEGFTVNGETGKYRTLSTAEWQYLFKTRTDASSKYGYATVADVPGVIILPDGDFQDPMKNNGSEAFVPSTTTDWTANVYTTGGNWEAMETAGAVFLPAAGYRNGSYVLQVGDNGYCWTSSVFDGDLAYYVSFYSYNVRPGDGYYRNRGCSVRLVTDCQ